MILKSIYNIYFFIYINYSYLYSHIFYDSKKSAIQKQNLNVIVCITIQKKNKKTK